LILCSNFSLHQTDVIYVKNTHRGFMPRVQLRQVLLYCILRPSTGNYQDNVSFVQHAHVCVCHCNIQKRCSLNRHEASVCILDIYKTFCIWKHFPKLKKFLSLNIKSFTPQYSWNIAKVGIKHQSGKKTCQWCFFQITYRYNHKQYKQNN
jgi:hypothetical protein